MRKGTHVKELRWIIEHIDGAGDLPSAELLRHWRSARTDIGNLRILLPVLVLLPGMLIIATALRALGIDSSYTVALAVIPFVLGWQVLETVLVRRHLRRRIELALA